MANAHQMRTKCAPRTYPHLNLHKPVAAYSPTPSTNAEYSFIRDPKQVRFKTSAMCVAAVGRIVALSTARAHDLQLSLLLGIAILIYGQHRQAECPAFANFCHGQAPCRSTSFEISTLSSVHLDSSFAAIALLWARRSGVKPDGDRASSPRRRPKCFRRENLHGIEANQGTSRKGRAMRRPAVPVMLTIWTWRRSWRVSGLS